MSARTSNAYLVSLTMHGLFAAAIFFSAYVFRDEVANTKIIELVAGAGDNYGATVAPALGNPDSTKTEPAPADASPIAAPPQPLEAVAAPPVSEAKPTPKVPDFAKQIERIADRAEKKNLQKFEKEQKAKAEAEAKAEAARAKEEAAAKAKEEASKQNRITKDEFDRRNGPKLNNTSRPAANNGQLKIAKIDTKGIWDGVRDGSTENMKGGAGGTALSREEGDMLDGYFSLLIQRLKSAHERPEGVSDLLNAQAEFTIAPDGTISRVRIVRSSGSSEFDQSVLSAFRNVGTIGPRPDTGGLLTKRVTFKMRDD